MSILNDAKLILTPNAFKESVLYTIKPTPATSTNFDVVRLTGATRVNERKLIENVGNNIPRIEYLNGVNVILIEPQKTNVLIKSEDLTDAVWSKSNTNISANEVESPSGIVNADLFYPASTGTFRRILQAETFETESVFSFFAKMNGKRYISTPNLVGSINTIGVTFDLQEGEVAYTRPDEGITAEIIDYGNNWYRCVVHSDGTGTNRAYILHSDSPNSTTITASGTDGVYIWGVQLTNIAGLYSYIPTDASTVTRNADVISVNPPTGTTEIKEYLLDGSINTITSIPATYEIPVGEFLKIIMT